MIFPIGEKLTSARIHGGLRIFSTSAAERCPSSELPFVAQYLISSVGLSPEKAIKASKQIPQIKTPSKPNIVLKFLRQIGLSDVCIRTVVSRMPSLLCSKVDKTLMPKIQALHRAGFSEAEITRLISESPYIFHLDFLTKVEFLSDLFGSKAILFKTLVKNKYILSSSLDKRMKPNISFLVGCGLSHSQIKHLLKCNPRIITRSLEYIKSIVERAQELGFSPGTGMFHLAVRSTCHLSRASLDAKVKVMKSFGWSDSQTSSAILKAPQLLFLSETNIRHKMDFFVDRVGCELSYVVARPSLLCCSFEKRLLPRYHVLQILSSKGLPKRKCGLHHCMKITNKEFEEKFILPYREEMPELDQVYLGAVSDSNG